MLQSDEKQIVDYPTYSEPTACARVMVHGDRPPGGLLTKVPSHKVTTCFHTVHHVRWIYQLLVHMSWYTVTTGWRTEKSALSCTMYCEINHAPVASRWSGRPCDFICMQPAHRQCGLRVKTEIGLLSYPFFLDESLALRITVLLKNVYPPRENCGVVDLEPGWWDECMAVNKPTWGGPPCKHPTRRTLVFELFTLR